MEGVSLIESHFPAIGGLEEAGYFGQQGESAVQLEHAYPFGNDTRRDISTIVFGQIPTETLFCPVLRLRFLLLLDLWFRIQRLCRPNSGIQSAEILCEQRLYTTLIRHYRTLCVEVAAPVTFERFWLYDEKTKPRFHWT